MAMDSTNTHLSESWKKAFFRQKPIIPAAIQLVSAVVIITVGCFGEAHLGTPWWSGILFIISGASMCLLIRWQLVKVEIFSFLTLMLSALASVAAIIIYSVEFSNPQLFPHAKSDVAITYRVDACILGLCSFQLGISVWILTILILSWKGAT